MRHFFLRVMLAAAILFVSHQVLFATDVGAPLLTKIMPKPNTGDLDAMAKLRLIRILVPYSKTIYFIDKGRQFGTAVDFGLALEKELNKGKKKEIERIRVAFIPTARDRLLPALNEGVGDIVMANMTVTPKRLEQVDFSAPIYADASEVLVSGPSAPALASLAELSGKEIAVRQSSSYYEHLVALNEQLKHDGKPEVRIKIIDENLEDEDLMEMVNAGLLPWTIVDQYKAEIWSTVFSDLKVHADIAVSTHGEIAWAIRKDSPQLKAVLDKFAGEHKIGTAFGNMLRNKFFKSDKILKKAYSPDDVERFKTLVAIFRKHAGEYSFDYLMLIAQGYQESQLDQTRRSPRGAVGVMQLLPATAADKDIGITGIAQSEDRNVEAGAKYLRHLIDVYINDPGITPRDQQLMAFAAYNAGPGNLRKFRKKATELGLDPNIWFGNVENGAAAIVGRETVQYVSNIFKYYIAYTLLEEQMALHKSSAETAATPKN
ncbi:lytic transglycosylase F [Rhizobium sp. AC44/96]|uniref:transglycosylase SLT domain-containing protein n=1 Tax=unclassified Rhizobium TaxID=2613769 RepID=UPI00080FFE57|nr:MULTISPECIES: lytic transglycosylase F [unclassified Rhizobium]MDM9620868.1 lytic transglycosylase F [Rhizobium sp. S96]OCJ02550.1 lytic transglycosylase F [Rhizobium sp. AC44/96]